MADIQIVYYEPYCQFNLPDFDTQCFCECASDAGCKFFLESQAGENVIPFGDCSRAKLRYKYKGWTGKRYEIEESFDPYCPVLDCMLVTLGKTTYPAVKVILDGKCIYNDFDDETEENNNERTD